MTGSGAVAVAATTRQPPAGGPPSRRQRPGAAPAPLLHRHPASARHVSAAFGTPLARALPALHDAQAGRLT